MPKRKFHEISSSRPTELSTKQQRQQESLRGHLENAQIQLVPALKLARGFERQKLGRRQKDAQNKESKDKDGQRIEAEIKALKALDLNKAAEFYTLRTICRIKTIAGSIIMPLELLQKGTAPSPYRDSASTNVTARLFKSTAVRKMMEAIEADIRKIVNSVEQQPEPKPASDIGQETIDENEHEASSNGHSEQPESDSENYSEEFDGKESRDLRVARNLNQDDNNVLTDEDDAFDSRLASDSDSEFHSDLQDTNADDESSASSPIEPRDSGLKSLQSRPAKEEQSAPKPRNTVSKPPKSTTFLPTLASGYISGSDFDSYQSEDEPAGKKPKRKNRMGQQARRALAEQQYGSAANHLKNSKGNKKGKQRGTRDTGWDVKRGAVDGDRRGYGVRKNVKLNIRPDPSQEKERPKPKTRAKDDTGQLHPSWVAKKKMKEQSQGIGVFLGKKMTFD